MGTGELTMTVRGENGRDAAIAHRVASVSVFLEDTRELVETYNEAHPDAPIAYDHCPGQADRPGG